uniref:Putative secreted protein n=1 Tax=Ixodes ricinus TaxID=34613 RepID=A0A6B0UDV6_IXORI
MWQSFLLKWLLVSAWLVRGKLFEVEVGDFLYFAHHCNKSTCFIFVSVLRVSCCRIFFCHKLWTVEMFLKCVSHCFLVGLSR